MVWGNKNRKDTRIFDSWYRMVWKEIVEEWARFKLWNAIVRERKDIRKNERKKCLVCGVEGQRLGNTCLKNVWKKNQEKSVWYKNGQENTRGKGKLWKVDKIQDLKRRVSGTEKESGSWNETERKKQECMGGAGRIEGRKEGNGSAQTKPRNEERKIVRRYRYSEAS